MNDKELLELAAKAAGIEFFTAFGSGGPIAIKESGGDRVWNPLTDDGDAFRLSVELDIGHAPYTDSDLSEHCCAYVNHRKHKGFHRVYEPYAECPYAATRRAIVKAAAEIGKGTK